MSAAGALVRGGEAERRLAVRTVPLLLASCLAACVVERVVEPEPADPLGGEALYRALLHGRDPAARPDVSAVPRGRWRELAARHDLDADGVVTEAELAGRDLLRFDRDRDGVVTLADFPVEAGEVAGPTDLVLTRTLARRALERALGDPAAGAGVAASPRPLAETWPERFASLDTDRDRTLSRAEFETAAPRPTTGRDPFGALLELVDRDDDDHVDWAELALHDA